MPLSPIGKNIPFERESAPSLPIDSRRVRAQRALLPGRSSKPWQVYRITRRVHTPFGRKKITCTATSMQARRYFSLVVCPRTSRLQLSFISFCQFSFISFCQFRRKLVPHRVTRRAIARNQAICFITRRQWSPLIDVSTIVSYSSTRTFPLASLAGLVQPLTSCFKLFLFALSATPTTPAHTVQLGRCK